MKLDSISNVRSYLANEGIVHEKDEPFVEQLGGGVSCDVWKVSVGENSWVLKQALDRLRVEADWYSDIERIHREHEVMEILYALLPKGSIPKVVYTDYVNHVYMMTAADGFTQTWKDGLMNQDFNPSFAKKAATLLAAIHECSNRIPVAEKTKLLDQKYFRQLRIDAFHLTVVKKYPHLTSAVQKLINELTTQKQCLVHGDFSPKNMLINKDGDLMLIDFEVAHWGNPVFDIAYCLGHLMLKGWHLDKKEKALQLIETFLISYDRSVDDLIPHLGLMLLARMDGKSPVNYIKDENVKNAIRKVAVNWIEGATINKNVFQNIKAALS